MIIQLIRRTLFNLKSIFSDSKVVSKTFLNYLFLMGVFSLIVILIVQLIVII